VRRYPVNTLVSGQSSLENEKPVILVVDDDADILAVIKMGLQLAGYAVHGFTDPIEALTHIERGCKDCELLVSDVRMPKMTGFEIIKRVKELRPEMKIVLMTAFEVNLTELQDVLPSMSVDSVIRKPFVPSKLIETIKPIFPHQ
jgi:CheY-like chemotaxis protein